MASHIGEVRCPNLVNDKPCLKLLIRKNGSCGQCGFKVNPQWFQVGHASLPGTSSKCQVEEFDREPQRLQSSTSLSNTAIVQESKYLNCLRDIVESIYILLIY